SRRGAGTLLPPSPGDRNMHGLESPRAFSKELPTPDPRGVQLRDSRLHFPPQPSLRCAELAAYDMNGSLETLSDLFGCQADEETHFHQTRLRGAFARQGIQRVIERYHDPVSFRGEIESRLECNSHISAALDGLARTGMIHQNLAHDSRRDTEK